MGWHKRWNTLLICVFNNIRKENSHAIMSANAGFTLTFLLVASSTQAKMCPKRLPEEHKNKRPACATRASLARSGRARDPTEWSRAQQVKLVV